ncbi:TPA: D-2-hydroxyacid dehydrogenase [bacterium]|nr:D-2-hydroxyacid dehydrogenase [bacterium]
MKILITSNPMGLEKSIPELAKKYPQCEFVYCPKSENLAEQIKDADIFMGWISKDLFLKADKLKWIQSPSTGIDSYISIKELANSDVILTSARGTHASCLAESTMGMILAFTRGIRHSIQRQLEHKWSVSEIRNKMVELTDSTMGIIGLGKIGCAIAKRAYAFDMNVIAVDVQAVEKPDCVCELCGMEGLDSLLKKSDYIVVTVPKTQGTISLIGEKEIAMMKPTAMLIGISRGGIIDQNALAKALKENRLACAALDVMEPEPLPPDSDLWDIENLLITPHIAGGTQFESKYIIEIFDENLKKFLNNEFPLRNQIDKQRGY